MPHCHKKSNDELPDGTRVTLHRIPADKAIRKLWLSHLPNFCENLRSAARVCNVHFEELDNLATIFPSKPEKVAGARHQLIRSTAETPSRNALACHVPEVYNISCNDVRSTHKLDRDTQHEILMNTTNTHLDDLANQTDNKVRFNIGFVNFSLLYLMFRTLSRSQKLYRGISLPSGHLLPSCKGDRG